jgi:hypothetical protein
MTKCGGPLYQTSAVATAVMTYIGVALATGWVMSPLLGDAPNAPRIGLIAGASTLAGMLASQSVTLRLLPRSSGVGITLAFSILTGGIYGYSWLKSGEMPNLIGTLQSLLLIGLAAGLFLKSTPRR